LRKSNVAASDHSHVLELILPLATIEEDITLDGCPDLHVEGATYLVQDIHYAIRHSCYLLNLIVDISSSTARTYNATPAFQGHLAWILDGFLILRDVESIWAPYSPTQQSEFEHCTVSIRAIHCLLTSLDHLLSKPLKRKGYRVLGHLCVELVGYSGALSETAVQALFCSSLLDLAAASLQDNSISQAVKIELLPALQNLLRSEHDSGSLGADILVCEH
jgi:hypothetical protein